MSTVLPGNHPPNASIDSRLVGPLLLKQVLALYFNSRSLYLNPFAGYRKGGPQCKGTYT